MKKIITILTLIILILLVATGCNNIDLDNISESTFNTSYIDTTEYKVTRVVDGDTLVVKINDEETKVRLIGIDTPESVHSDESKNCSFGKTASDYTKNLLSDESVTLEYDVEQYDTYGRLLAYVYLDDNMINYDLVLNGYAVAKEYPPNVKYADEFTEAQIEAEKSKSGMWSDNVSNSECNLKDQYFINY